MRDLRFDLRYLRECKPDLYTLRRIAEEALLRALSAERKLEMSEQSVTGREESNVQADLPAL